MIIKIKYLIYRAFVKAKCRICVKLVAKGFTSLKHFKKFDSEKFTSIMKEKQRDRINEILKCFNSKNLNKYKLIEMSLPPASEDSRKSVTWLFNLTQSMTKNNNSAKRIEKKQFLLSKPIVCLPGNALESH